MILKEISQKRLKIVFNYHFRINIHKSRNFFQSNFFQLILEECKLIYVQWFREFFVSSFERNWLTIKRACITCSEVPTNTFENHKASQFSGHIVVSEQAVYLSMLADGGGIAGGILAGLSSDYTGFSIIQRISIFYLKLRRKINFLKLGSIDAVNQGNWSLSIKWRGEAFGIVDKNY